MTTPTIVWTEIPVTDLAAAGRFYETVFGMTLSPFDMGPVATLVFGADGIGGNLYAGEPGQGRGPALHIAVADTVEAAAARCTAAGGALIGPVVDIPEGRFQMATDPDGNRLGLFQRKAA